MRPRKKATSTQDKLEKSLKEAATKPKKEKVSGVKAEVYKPRAKPGLGRNPESDEEWLQNIEKKYNQLKERKSSTALILMSEFAFLLDLAREREWDGVVNPNSSFNTP